MAYDVIRMVPRVKVEAQTYGEGTGTLYCEVLSSEDKAFTTYRFWGAFAPSTNLTDAPLGSIFIRTDAGNVKMYIYTASDTWTVVGAQS